MHCSKTIQRLVSKRTSLFALCLSLTFPLAAQQVQTNVAVNQTAVTTQNNINEVDRPDVETLVRSGSPEVSITSQHISRLSNVHHMYLRQAIAGIEVYGTESSIHFEADGSTLLMHNNFVANLDQQLRSAAPRLSAEEAIAAVSSQMGYSLDNIELQKEEGGVQRIALYNDAGISLREIPVKLIYYYNENVGVVAAWELSVLELDSSDWWNFWVDASTGAILDKSNFFASCRFDESEDGDNHGHDHEHNDAQIKAFQKFELPTPAEKVETSGTMVAPREYTVFAMPVESPNHGDRSVVSIDDVENATASPFGWHNDGTDDYTITLGNNVYAREDTNADNSGGFSPDGGVNLEFNYTLDLNVNNNSASQEAAITNLFYWNNIIHDVLYFYGFTPAAGNFQWDNNGEGGSGSDLVIAEAQDGSGTCNANFGTPADGSIPLMQMYICGTRDGDYDNGVIVHEYAHGISNRLVGGRLNASALTNSEQMGEGWSDIYGLLLTMEPGDSGEDVRGIGTWLVGEDADGPGIRTYPYSTDFGINSLTYNDINTEAQPHGVGAVWASTLWDLTWLLVDDYGFSTDFYSVTGNVNNDAGNVQALALVTEGLALLAANPGFESGRDAILAADTAIYGGANHCAIWEAFAKRGMGASGSEGNTNNTTDGSAAFDLPTNIAGFDNSISQACLAGGLQTSLTGGFPSGGTYGGPGVNNTAGNTYSFNPATAGVGLHAITYTVNDFCNNNASTVFTEYIEVQDSDLQLTCPADMIVQADSFTSCTAQVVFDYPVPVGDLCDRTLADLSQNTNNTNTNALHCGGSQNGHARLFNLNTEGINRNYHLDGIDVKITSSTGAVPIIANIYLSSQLTGGITNYGFPVSSYVEPFASASSVVPTLVDAFHTIPMDVFLPAGSEFYVEVITPSSDPALVAYNSAGSPPANETAAGYIGSNGCGIGTYGTLASIGFGELAALIQISGSESNEYTTTQTGGPVSGSVFSAGATTVTFQTSSLTQGTSNCSFDVVVQGKPTIFDNGIWSPAVPGAGAHAVFSENYSTNTDNVSACSCEVDSGNTVTVEAGDHLDIYGNVIVNGSLIIEHQGSLRQTDDAATVANNGTINVNTTSPNLASRDFMILGSPMDGDTRNGVWNSAFLVLNHTTANFVPNPLVEALMPGAENFADDNYDNWNAYSGAITPGEGFIVRPQAGFGQPGGVFNYTYNSGTLNNGVVAFDVVYNDDPDTADPDDDKNYSPNVVANPYPSAISTADFIVANDMVDEVYFWEHITPPSSTIPGAGSMDFSMEDISMRNITGGVAATNYTGPAVNSTTYNQYIAASQGFGFKANLDEVINNGGNVNDDLIFNNSMRVVGNNDNLRGPENKDRILLAVASSEYDVKRTTLIGFLPEASPGMDRGYDSRRLATMLSIYSHLQDGSGQLGIQAREAFQTDIEVELGFSTLIDANTYYKISIEQIEGSNLAGVTVYLKDNHNPSYGLHNLSSAPYEFTSEATTQHNRFTLLFEPSEVLDTSDFLSQEIGLYPNPANDMVRIYSGQQEMSRVQIFDVQGRQIRSVELNNVSNLDLDLRNLQAAIYFVRIDTDQGSITKRVIKN